MILIIIEKCKKKNKKKKPRLSFLLLWLAHGFDKYRLYLNGKS
jgi:hypothetical protein